MAALHKVHLKSIKMERDQIKSADEESYVDKVEEASFSFRAYDSLESCAEA
jgi:hypothetical protein